MRYEVEVNKQGTVTIPEEVRKLLGVDENDRLVFESTNEGVILRPAAPIEMYSDERIAEFESDADSIADILPELEQQ
jgi:AbrB family looped-hinge helix DNA binding protein